MTPLQAEAFHRGRQVAEKLARRLLAQGMTPEELRKEVAARRDESGDEDSLYWDEGAGVGVEQAIAKTDLSCGKNIAKGSAPFEECGRPGSRFYLHDGSVCAYCDGCDYVCGEPLTREQALEHLARLLGDGAA